MKITMLALMSLVSFSAFADDEDFKVTPHPDTASVYIEVLGQTAKQIFNSLNEVTSHGRGTGLLTKNLVIRGTCTQGETSPSSRCVIGISTDKTAPRF